MRPDAASAHYTQLCTGYVSGGTAHHAGDYILLFIFAAEILGEISEFYLVFPFWDTVLHTLNGFLAAAIGLSLVDLLNRSEKIIFHLSPLFTAMWRSVFP